MLLIDYTYFNTGLAFIPQLDLVYNRNRVTRFIEIYEPEYLNRVLGYELSVAFTAGLGAPEVEQRWNDLKNGADFSYFGSKRHWNGFVNTLKQSPIAMYVYYWYTRKQATPTTGSGNVMPSLENGDRASFMRDMIQVWDDMVCENMILYQFLTANIDLYPEFKTCPFYRWRCKRGMHRSMYGDVDLYIPLNNLNI